MRRVTCRPHLGPVRLLALGVDAPAEAGLDLVGRERADRIPRGEGGEPGGVKGSEGGVTRGEPTAESGETGRREIVIKGVGGDGCREFVAEVVKHRREGCVAVSGLPHEGA